MSTNARQTIYLWRDAMDRHSFSAGVKSPAGNFDAWTTLPIEGIRAFFGQAVALDCQALRPNVPLAVTITTAADRGVNIERKP